MSIVLFDLDDTLLDGRVIDALALKYQFYYDLNRLRTNLKTGLLSHERTTRSIIKLLRGKRVKEILDVVKKIPLMLNTNKMLNNLRNEGYRLGVISDGLDIVVNNFAEQFSFDYSVAHKVEVKDGKLTGKVKLVNCNGKYLSWKKDVIKQIKKETNSRIIAVGNGDLDAPMLKEADIGIAFNASEQAIDMANIVVKDKDMIIVLKAIKWSMKNL